MTVWLVNAFWDLPQEGNRPQRYWLMAQAFAKAGHRVVYWTSDFSHATKKKRALAGVEPEATTYEAEGIRVNLLPTKPYKKNIGLARLFSHCALARTFTARAKKEQECPDLLVATTPPLGLCDAARAFAKTCGAKFVCDIQDAWPETFERLVSRFLLAPLRRIARRIYCSADAITATGRAYLELAAAAGANVPMRVVPQVIAPRPLPRRTAEESRELKLVYCGNMSLSYDLETVIQAVKNSPEMTLDLAGNGPDRARLEALAGGCARIRFHGYLDEGALAQLLDSCTIGIIPMFPESCVTIPGKLADYAAAGLRIVECLGGECSEVVMRFSAGAHYAPRDVASFQMALQASGQTIPDREGFRAAYDATHILADFVQFTQSIP